MAIHHDQISEFVQPANPAPTRWPPACSGCAYFKPSGYRDVKGECHINPPVIVPLPELPTTFEPDRVIQELTFWPRVMPIDWCGQFKNK